MRATRVAAIVAVLATALAGCSGGAPAVPLPTIAPGGTASGGPPSGAASSAAAPGATPTALPVYYAAQTPAGLRLYREFHRVTTADPVSDAVRELFAQPLDPDYRTLWPAGVTLRTPVSTAAGVTTVDLAGVDGTRLPAAAAPLAVQQLVLTVQGTRQATDPVRILVQGKPVNTLWNAVAVAAPVTRGDVYALRSLVQIDDPQNGSTVGRDVVVSGEAAVFEGTVAWDVLRGTTVLHTGTTTTAEGQKFSPFRFTLALAPGQYTVRVREDDPSGGAGRPAFTDDKVITVGG